MNSAFGSPRPEEALLAAHGIAGRCDGAREAWLDIIFTRRDRRHHSTAGVEMQALFVEVMVDRWAERQSVKSTGFLLTKI